MKNLSDLSTPKASTLLMVWCKENGIDHKSSLTWQSICEMFNVEVKKGEFPRWSLIRAINVAKGHEAPTQEEEAQESAGSALALQIAEAVKNLLPQSEVDESKVIELIKKHSPFKKLEISVNGGEFKKVEGVHKQFEQIMKAISTGIPIMLVGEAGAGKTTCVDGVAKALERTFYYMSVGSQTTKSDLMGFIDANGVYRPSVFRKAFEEGGVFLLDEVDAGNANVITCLNAALANGVCSFPDGMIERHKDFVCVASANTFGTGASRSYVGRNQLDAASLDRFAVIEFEYDEGFERALAGNDEWVDRVQRIRKAVKGERIVVSPRASIYGAQLLKAGMKEKDVMEMVIIKGAPADLRSKILGA